jgi:hypothetical protein
MYNPYFLAGMFLLGLLLQPIVALSQSGSFGLIDTTGQVVIPFEYTSLSHPFDNRIVAYKDGLTGVFDTQGTLIIPFDTPHISSFDQGMATYSTGQKCGYIDTSRTIKVSVTYDRCNPFIDSLAWVGKNTEEGLRYGVVNNQGQLIIPCIYEQAGSHLYMNDLFKVNQQGKHGLIDRQGNQITSIKYSEIGTFSEGLLRVRKNGLFGFVNSTGEEVIACQFQRAGYFNNGLVYTRNQQEEVYRDRKLAAVINITGWNLLTGFSEDGLAQFKENELIGFRNRLGEVVIKPQYDVISALENGRSRVVKNGYNGVLDANKNVIIPIVYHSIGADSDGIIIARKGDHYGALDTVGKVVIPFIFEYIERFRNGQTYSLAKNNGAYGVIDKQGETLIPFSYKNVPDLRFPYGLCPFEKEGKMGYLNLQGDVVIPFEYLTARAFSDSGVAICKKAD